MTKPLWLPWATRNPIKQGSNDPHIIPIGDIFHVAVSKADSLHDWFNGPSGGIESTGYIRFNGTIEQYRPFNIECDAQSDGNSFLYRGHLSGFNSWETEGMGDGVWTDAQLNTIKRIIAFKHEHWGHPLVQCPAWNAPGFGYHRLFKQWNQNAHSCPGDRRVQQWNRIIVPWMRGEGNDDMAFSESELRRIVRQESHLGTVDALNDPRWHAYGEDDDVKRKMSNIILRTDYGLRLMRNSLTQARGQIDKAIKMIDANANPAEVKALLENLDATINLVVKNDESVS